MNASTEDTTKEFIEKTPEKIPVSVYSIDFSPDVKGETESETAKTELAEMPAKSSLAKTLAGWQNALVVAGILAIAALHFVIQSSFISSESAKLLPVVAVQDRVEPITERNVEAEPIKFETQKINDVETPKITPKIREKRVETAPVKVQPKKKTTVETPAMRLRRAERILTGV